MISHHTFDDGMIRLRTFTFLAHLHLHWVIASTLDLADFPFGVALLDEKLALLVDVQSFLALITIYL